MPIITCSAKRAGKVAPELTSKGYCSTKKLHYIGTKLHSVAFHRPGGLPFPEILGLRASKVRSHQGLIVHVFGKIAAALALNIF